MEHESEPNREQPDAPEEKEPAGCGTIILRLVIAAVVIFIAAVAFVFGACLLA